MIVSVTLSNGPADRVIAALESVADHVHGHLVVDTGMSAHDRDAIQSRVADVVFVEKAWDGDFSSMRNFAFGQANLKNVQDDTFPGSHSYGLMLDTDERVVWGDLSYVKLVELFDAREDVDVWRMKDESGVYERERFFRLPLTGKFEGPTHEAFVGAVNAETLPHARMTSLAKTAEEMREKHSRDVSILNAHTAKRPGDPRWWYYLGDSRELLGDKYGAIDAFRRCADLKGWNEESAWACFRAANCLNAEGHWHDALLECLKGLERHPGVAELYWYAGFCCLRGGMYDRALFWGKAAAALGAYEGVGKYIVRIGFKNVVGLWEGPFNVQKMALMGLGDARGAAEAAAKVGMAEKARMEFLRT